MSKPNNLKVSTIEESKQELDKLFKDLFVDRIVKSISLLNDDLPRNINGIFKSFNEDVGRHIIELQEYLEKPLSTTSKTCDEIQEKIDWIEKKLENHENLQNMIIKSLDTLINNITIINSKNIININKKFWFIIASLGFNLAVMVCLLTIR